MRQSDVLYVRLDERPPGVLLWSLPPRRRLLPRTVVAWELNTAPAYGTVLGRGESSVREAEAAVAEAVEAEVAVAEHVEAEIKAPSAMELETEPGDPPAPVEPRSAD